MENSSGKKRRRPFRLSGLQLEQARMLRLQESLSLREIGDCLKVSHMAVWRALECGERGGDGNEK